MLLEQELDDLQAKGHVPRFIGLRRKTEGDRSHVAIVGGARHERHEQQIGKHIFEGKTDRHQEFEGSRCACVIEEAFWYRQVPHTIMHVRKILETVEVFVVVAHGMNLRLHMP